MAVGAQHADLAGERVKCRRHCSNLRVINAIGPGEHHYVSEHPSIMTDGASERSMLKITFTEQRTKSEWVSFAERGGSVQPSRCRSNPSSATV
jgi:hypothetical protein